MEHDFIFFGLVFITSFTVAALATPLASKLALKGAVIDHPGKHKTHGKAKPLLGGLAIFCGFAATIFIFLDVDDKLLSLVTATLILLITGILDDVYNLKPLIKVAGQTASASIVIVWNAHLFRFMVDYFERFFIPEYIVLGLIIGWIVLMINAFNLIDGMDGLAAGTAAIIFIAMAVLSIIEGGRPNILGVQLIGAGACLGFLIFNFNPAKIFMGDAGSMLLGFVLATTHLYTIKYPFSAALVLGSFFIFAYPALDVSYAIYRRICNRTPLFQADRGHIHHVLRSMGLSARKTVLVLYAVNIFFAKMAIILLGLGISPRILLLTGIFTVLFVILLFKLLLLVSAQNEIGMK